MDIIIYKFPSCPLKKWPRIQVRAKARNAAVALERLLEERFSEPEALGAAEGGWGTGWNSMNFLEDPVINMDEPLYRELLKSSLFVLFSRNQLRNSVLYFIYIYCSSFWEWPWLTLCFLGRLVGPRI